MSTRAIINFVSNEGNDLSIYVHGDGGPRWLGKQLGEILENMEVGNGCPSGVIFGEYASTSDDAILQVISLIKGDRVGYVYLTARGQDGNREDLWDIDYVYNVHFHSENCGNTEVTIQCDALNREPSPPAMFSRRVGIWIAQDDIRARAVYAAREARELAKAGK